MTNTTSEWQSPYQSPEYYLIAQHFGFAAYALTSDQGEVYFYGESPKIAWEVSEHFNLPELPEGGIAYRFNGVVSDITNVPETSYLTRVVGVEDFFAGKYSKRLQRALRYADQRAELAIVERGEEISEVLRLFDQYPERRDQLDDGLFVKFVKCLASAGLAKVYVLRSESVAVAAAVALQRGDLINLRYYTAERVNNAGHNLLFRVMQHAFNEGTRTVDMSGVRHPNLCDDKDRGINEFKQQFGGRIVEFVRVADRPDPEK